MPHKTISSAFKHAEANNSLSFLDSVDNRSSFGVVKFDDLVNTLEYVAAVYAQKLSDQLNKADASSSGHLADQTIPLDVVVFGSIYSVEIQTLKYAKFVDEGVSGWATSNGSPYKFKTRGVNPDGDMVKSIRAYLLHEGKMSKVTYLKGRSVSNRERKRERIGDASKQEAITAAYMIKRFGIKPTHYWRNATDDMTDIIKKEFSAALKVDIINNFGK